MSSFYKEEHWESETANEQTPGGTASGSDVSPAVGLVPFLTIYHRGIPMMVKDGKGIVLKSFTHSHT